MPTDIITWGFGGVDRAKEWVSPDGRLNNQSLMNNDGSALDLWPTNGTRPTQHDLCEVTLNRYRWDSPKQERINISAMADGGSHDGAFRIGVERTGSGVFRDILFAFEDVTPGVAVCPFKITPSGAYVSDDGGTSWRKL